MRYTAQVYHVQINNGYQQYTPSTNMQTSVACVIVFYIDSRGFAKPKKRFKLLAVTFVSCFNVMFAQYRRLGLLSAYAYNSVR